MKKAILFDLDGTLLDSTEGVLESAAHAARQLGLPELSHDTMLKFVGPPIQDSFKIHYGLGEESAQKAAELFRSYYKEKSLLKAVPYPGLIETLALLQRMGCTLGVATYKREDYALTILDHFGIAPFCRSMHGADNFNKLSKADIVNLCLNELGAARKDSVLVGDTAHDAKGASLAGIDFIGVTFGFGFKTKEDVDAFANIGCAETIQQIVEYVK